MRNLFAEIETKEADRKWLHEQLNDAGVTRENRTRGMCLMGRMRILFERLRDMKRVKGDCPACGGKLTWVTASDARGWVCMDTIGCTYKDIVPPETIEPPPLIVADVNGKYPCCKNALGTWTCERCGSDVREMKGLPCPAIPLDKRWSYCGPEHRV